MSSHKFLQVVRVLTLGIPEKEMHLRPTSRKIYARLNQRAASLFVFLFDSQRRVLHPQSRHHSRTGPSLSKSTARTALPAS